MLLAPCPPHTLTHPPSVRLSVHPLIPLRISAVPPSPRLWGWLHMCCPRRLVMLVLTAPISVTANYVAVTASSHLRTATPPAIRPLSPQVVGALSDFCRGTKPILGARQQSVIASQKGVRVLYVRKYRNLKAGCEVCSWTGIPFSVWGFNERIRYLDAFLLTCKCFGAVAWHTILSQG